MLDSLLTLTKSGAAWLAGAFVVFAALHFGVVALTRFQEPVFALLAIASLAALLVTAAYTGGKWVLRRVHPGGPAGD